MAGRGSSARKKRRTKPRTEAPKPQRVIPVSRGFRAVIRDRLDELGMTTYQLSGAVNKNQSENAIYGFLAAGSGKSIKTDNLEKMLEAIGIGLVVIPGDPPIMKGKRS